MQFTEKMDICKKASIKTTNRFTRISLPEDLGVELFSTEEWPDKISEFYH